MVASSKTYQLLVADDDSGFRETLRNIFEPPFRMLEAQSGEEAVAIAEAYPIDIALLDMHMDVLTGLDTMRIVKSIHTGIPCILITADATETLRKEADVAHAYSVLAKPVSKRELVSTVGTALEDVYQDMVISEKLGRR